MVSGGRSPKAGAVASLAPSAPPKAMQAAADGGRSQKMGMSENGVSLNPMVNDHYPY